jgi:hypothetical protein
VRGVPVTGGVRRWPLFVIAAPAAVSIWSGWVGLGGMCGFGLVHPLPGIADGFELNTAITLPVGVEAYGAYALGAWLSLGEDHPARKFARRSAVGSLVLGMLGQVAYHLLAAAHQARAPWPVVVLVACLPVCTLGFGAALTHLLRVPVPAPETAPAAVPESAPAALPERVPVPVPEVHPAALPSAPARRTRSAPARRTRPVPVTAESAEAEFAAELAAGEIPSIRKIRAVLHVGQDRARELQAHLGMLTPAGRSIRDIRDEIRQPAEPATP